MMSGIGGKNTRPERLIRSELHRRGFRFRIHYSNLPGKPDIVFPKHKAIITVHGCFWHGHHCHLFKWPSSNPEFWRNKIEENISRDSGNLEKYKAAGWRVLVIWECAVKGKSRLEPETLMNTIEEWIRSDDPFVEIQGDTSFPSRNSYS